jgi:hypothetical protein
MNVEFLTIVVRSTPQEIDEVINGHRLVFTCLTFEADEFDLNVNRIEWKKMKSLFFIRIDVVDQTLAMLTVSGHIGEPLAEI